jgi:hypothetical protein
MIVNAINFASLYSRDASEGVEISMKLHFRNTPLVTESDVLETILQHDEPGWIFSIPEQPIISELHVNH